MLTVEQVVEAQQLTFWPRRRVLQTSEFVNTDLAQPLILIPANQVLDRRKGHVERASPGRSGPAHIDRERTWRWPEPGFNVVLGQVLHVVPAPAGQDLFRRPWHVSKFNLLPLDHVAVGTRGETVDVEENRQWQIAAFGWGCFELWAAGI